MRTRWRTCDGNIWQPPVAGPPPAAPTDPTFHEFASRWFTAASRELAANTIADYEWQLRVHLLPFFRTHRLGQITVAEVDRYREAKAAERVLSATSINKTITRLGQILEVAVEREMIGRNPVKVGRRKIKVARYERGYLDNADHIVAMLDAAGQLDTEARADRKGGRRMLVCVLMFTGLRISEACALRWRHVDLAMGRLRVPATKTGAAVRWVKLLPVLREELAAHKAVSRRKGPDDWVLPTANGTPRNKDNARQRVWLPSSNAPTSCSPTATRRRCRTVSRRTRHE